MRVRHDGAWRTIRGGRVRINNAWRRLTGAKAYISGEWKDVARFIEPLALTVTPPAVEGGRFVPDFVVSDAASATPSGGLAPFTYSWARVGAGDISITSPTSSSTTFGRFFESEGNASETFRCTVTDALGSTATGDVSVILSGFNNPFDPF